MEPPKNGIQARADNNLAEQSRFDIDAQTGFPVIRVSPCARQITAEDVALAEEEDDWEHCHNFPH